MTTYYTKQGRRYVPADPQPVPADPKPDYDDVGKGPWRDGPPPSVGWWPASVTNYTNMLRWWDGAKWSHFAFSQQSAETAAKNAAIPAVWPGEPILWRDRADWWPERSRT